MAVIIPKATVSKDCCVCQFEKNFFCTAGIFNVRDEVSQRIKHERCPLTEVSDKEYEKLKKKIIKPVLDDIKTDISMFVDKCRGGNDIDIHDVFKIIDNHS